MKLFGVTMTYNEAPMVPYVMPYFEKLGFEKLVVYDNESTDNTVDLLKRYDFVEVRTMYTNNKLTDSMYQYIKNNIWKEFKCVPNSWMYVGDFDEVLYLRGGEISRNTLRRKLRKVIIC